MPVVRLHVFGDSAIDVCETRVTPSTSHLFSLLLYMGIEGGRTISRGQLTALLFPDCRGAEALHRLRQLVYRARKLGVPLETSQYGISLDRTAVTSDVQRTLEAPHIPREYLSAGSLHVLPHFHPPTAPLSRWLESYRDRVRTSLIRSLTHELASLRIRGEWRDVELIARTLIDIDPYNETATLGLAESLARIGSKTHAVSLLRQFEADVGKASQSLVLPARVLARRISDAHMSERSTSDTPLVGRKNEMDRLLGFWSRARSGRFVSVSLCGAESMGKSRLATECAASVRIDGSGTAIVTRRLPLDSQRPLSLFSDITKSLLSMRGAAGCSPGTLSLLARLTCASGLADSVESERRDSEYSNVAVRRAIIDLFDSVLSEQPLLLVIDDADHLDRITLSLLDDLRKSLSTKPCLLILVSRLLTYRGVSDTSRVVVSGLPLGEATELASELNKLLSHPASAEVLERCVGLAAGNPGHLRLLLQHRSTTESTTRIPTDLVASLDARLGTLSAKALHLLLACAIVDSHLTTKDLSAITGLRGYSVLQSLQELEDHALISLGPTGIQCSSSLIEERIRSLATPAVSAALHLRAAKRLERSVAKSTPSQSIAWRIAEHWRRAGVVENALQWKQMCWQQSLSIGQPVAAAASIREELADASSTEERARLLTSLAAALQALGDFPSLAQVLEERLALSTEVLDSPSVRSSLAFDLFEARIAHSTELEPLVGPLQGHLRDTLLAKPRRLRAARLLMRAADHLFDPRVAREAFTVLRAIGPCDPSTELLKLQSLHLYHAVFGERADAISSVEHAQALADRVAPSWTRIASLTSSVIAHRLVCPGPTRYNILEAAFSECRNYEVNRTALTVAAILTSLYFDDGNLAKAREWGAICSDVAARASSDSLAIDYFVTQIDLALLSRDHERAQSMMAAFTSFAPPLIGPRMKREVLVYKTRVDQFCGRGTSECDLEVLLQFHAMGSKYSRHDDNVEVIWVALQERGASDRASAILSSYLHGERREVRPCNFWLRNRTAGDPVWQDPGLTFLSLGYEPRRWENEIAQPLLAAGR